MAEWLRRKVLRLEVLGSSSGSFFQAFFAHVYSTVTVLLEYLDPTIHTYFVFAL